MQTDDSEAELVKAEFCGYPIKKVGSKRSKSLAVLSCHVFFHGRSQVIHLSYGIYHTSCPVGPRYDKSHSHLHLHLGV